MAAKVGDRVEFGSDVEPCRGVVVSVHGEVVIMRWDSGVEAVTTVGLLAALACGGKRREVESTATVRA
jgi:hypothetical protein